MDISERIQGRRGVAKKRERFSAIVASAMDAIIAVDAEQKIMLFNKAAETMFGYSAQENPRRIDRPIDAQRFHAALESMRGGFAESGEDHAHNGSNRSGRVEG